MNAYEELCNKLGKDGMYLYTLLMKVYELSYDDNFFIKSEALALIPLPDDTEREACFNRAVELELLREAFGEPNAPGGRSLIKPGFKLYFFVNGVDGNWAVDKTFEELTPADRIFFSIPAEVLLIQRKKEFVGIVLDAEPDQWPPYAFGSNLSDLLDEVDRRFGPERKVEIMSLKTPDGHVPNADLHAMHIY